MSKIVDVTSPLFQLHKKTVESSNGVVPKKPKEIKEQGSAVNGYVLSHRQFANTNGTTDNIEIWVTGDFQESDVNIATGLFVSSNEIKSFVFTSHKMSTDEITEYKRTHKNAGNKQYSDGEHTGEISLKGGQIIKISSFVPWTTGGAAVHPGQSIRMLNLRYEIRTDGVKSFADWKCESIMRWEPPETQNLQNLGQLLAATTQLPSLLHTVETQNLPISDELAEKYREAVASGNSFRIKDVDREIRFAKATPEQRALMESVICIPMDGLNEELGFNFGTLIAPVNIKASIGKTKKEATEESYAILEGGTFVTQDQGGKFRRIQLGLKFGKAVQKRIGISRPENLVEFAERLLRVSPGVVVGTVNAVESTSETNRIEVDSNDQPLSDYAIWVDVKIIDFDMATAVMLSGIEITEAYAKYVMERSEQAKEAEKFEKDDPPTRFGMAVYEVTASRHTLDGANYRFFFFHPELDDTKAMLFGELQQKNKWTRQQTVEKVSEHLSGKNVEGVKVTDFKRPVFNAEKMATIFAVKKYEADRVEKGVKKTLSTAQLLEHWEEQHAEKGKNPVAVQNNVPEPKAPAQDDNSESKKRGGRKPGPAKKMKVQETIQD